MPVTVIRDRAPLCRTCRRALKSWWFGATDDSERCPFCEERAVRVSIRMMFRRIASKGAP